MARQGKQPEPTHRTAQHSTAQHSTAQHSTAQHSTAQHSTAQHSTAQHSTAQHRTSGLSQIRPPWFTSSTVTVKVSLSCHTKPTVEKAEEEQAELAMLVLEQFQMLKCFLMLEKLQLELQWHLLLGWGQTALLKRC
ncbi:MAG: DNA methylase [Trebouxia sp. A1-2]|nr:MAG: DNA methylase [Trebouxia sp. A1-2]